MFHRIGAAAYKNNLDNTLEICRLLGNPEKKFRSVHIAGTNGKGSVSHMLASVFREAGYKTGLFTSPHLKDFRERIRIDGRMISRRRVIRFIADHQQEFSKIQPSFFEWTWGLAAEYFAEQQVDIAIIETGMGGRLDSTNVIEPELAVITNIGLDHMQFLGDTLDKIAIEKAGIIKPGVPVVIGETHTKTQRVFIQKASDLKTSIKFADMSFKVESYSQLGAKKPLLRISVRNNSFHETESYTLPLTGLYQLKNVCTVLQCLEILKERYHMITRERIRRGLRHVVKNTRLQGRWQVIGTHPLTIADIGHNKDGILQVVSQIERSVFKTLHMVIGVVNDKDIDAMLNLFPKNASYYFCKADIPRGLDAEMLKRKAELASLKGEAYISVHEAFTAARAAADDADLIVVTGSAFVVAEVI